MTIAYPDVSNYQRDMALQPGTVAACAKATEGTGFADGYYAHYRAEAARVGAVFFAYHFLHPGAAAAQARWCHSVTGSGVNAMIDLEPTGGVMPSLQDAIDFAAEYRALGGRCTLAYLPRWAWQQLGSPSLAPLARAGLSLVSSDYTTYSDTGPGWTGYGGLDPVIWQYTDRLAYSGQAVDFNAFRGTLDQFSALLGYTTQGADMAAVDETSASYQALIWRVKALVDLVAVEDGPTKGEANALAAAVAKLAAPPAVDVVALGRQLAGDAVFVAAVAAAVAAKIPAAPTADQIAAAVAKHFGTDLSQG